MTLEQLEVKKVGILVKFGVKIEELSSSDLFSPKYNRETKDILGFDLVRRNTERRAKELAKELLS
jgi:hypothetical protein